MSGSWFPDELEVKECIFHKCIPLRFWKEQFTTKLFTSLTMLALKKNWCWISYQISNFSSFHLGAFLFHLGWASAIWTWSKKLLELVLHRARSLLPGFVTKIHDAEKHRYPGGTKVHGVLWYPPVASLLTLGRKSDRITTQGTRRINICLPLSGGLQDRNVIFFHSFLSVRGHSP